MCSRPQGCVGFPEGIIWPAEHLLQLVSCVAGSALTFRTPYTFVGLMAGRTNVGDEDLRFGVWAEDCD